MLRPCFALEAARLQLTLALAGHQAVGCDRNCEGEESDSDSEDDWLASETESASETEAEHGTASERGTSEAASEESDDEAGSVVSEAAVTRRQGQFAHHRHHRLSPRPVSDEASEKGATDSGSEESDDEAHSVVSDPSWPGPRPGPRLELARPRLTPDGGSPSSSCSSAWLPDREDLRRMRSFLAAEPTAGFLGSEDSGSEGD
jgi:hypothetical protein